MSRNLRLALLQNLHEVADADFSSCHEVEEAQTSRVGERREQDHKIEGFSALRHHFIIYALTDMFFALYIRLNECEVCE